ncbi:Hypothetical protein A7982_01749 [Minicystis rosea]|nr:Hypothetical protein A7982_01749 [Minicystis rosea]
MDGGLRWSGMMGRASLLALALVLGCSKTGSEATPAASGSAAPPLGQDDLASSNVDSVLGRGVPLVRVTKTAIELVGDPSGRVALPPRERWGEGIDAAFKPGGASDPYLEPLSAALGRAKRGAVTAISFDRALPQRIVGEVLHTAAHAGYATAHLVVRRPDGRVGFLALTLPPSKRPEKASSTAVSVFVTAHGLSVKTDRGNMKAGCAEPGPGMTLPFGPSGLDFEGLRACAGKLRASMAETPERHQVTIMANPDIVFADLVRVMDALRDDGAGHALFPDVVMGMMR